MPMTPNGILMRPICRSLGRRHMPVISPTGSGSSATAQSPSAMPRILWASRVSRSTMAGASPASRAAIRSFSFSSISTSVWSRSAWAIFFSSSFLMAEESLARVWDAVFASCATFSICSVTLIVLLLSSDSAVCSVADDKIVPVDNFVAVLVTKNLQNLPGVLADDADQFGRIVIGHPLGELFAVEIAEAHGITAFKGAIQLPDPRGQEALPPFRYSIVCAIIEDQLAFRLFGKGNPVFACGHRIARRQEVGAELVAIEKVEQVVGGQAIDDRCPGSEQSGTLGRFQLGRHAAC